MIVHKRKNEPFHCATAHNALPRAQFARRAGTPHPSHSPHPLSPLLHLLLIIFYVGRRARTTSLNSNDSFLLRTPTHLYLWHGKGASDNTRKAAQQISHHPFMKANSRKHAEIAEESEPGLYLFVFLFIINFKVYIYYLLLILKFIFIIYY